MGNNDQRISKRNNSSFLKGGISQPKEMMPDINCNVFDGFYIQEEPENQQYKVKCPYCKAFNFDDGLGNYIKCDHCIKVFQTIDNEVKKITTNIADNQIDYEKHYTLNDLHKIPEISYVLFYCNRDLLPKELIQNGKIDYKTLIQKLLIPFFQLKGRIIKPGKIFKVGQFEFKVIFCQPNSGRVSKNTKLQCYEWYNSNQNLQQITLSPLLPPGLKHEQYINSLLSEQQITNYLNQYLMNQHLNLNQIIDIRDHKYILISGDIENGCITKDTKITLLNEPILELKKLVLSITKTEILAKINPNFNLNDVNEENILKNFVQPYFKGLSRYIKKNQQIQILDYSFKVFFSAPSQGLVGNKTEITVKIMNRDLMNSSLELSSGYRDSDILHQENVEEDKEEGLYKNSIFQMNFLANGTASRDFFSRDYEENEGQEIRQRQPHHLQQRQQNFTVVQNHNQSVVNSIRQNQQHLSMLNIHVDQEENKQQNSNLQNNENVSNNNNNIIEEDVPDIPEERAMRVPRNLINQQVRGNHMAINEYQEENVMNSSNDSRIAINADRVLQRGNRRQFINEIIQQLAAESDDDMGNVNRLISALVLLNNEEGLRRSDSIYGAPQQMINRLPEREINLKFNQDKRLTDEDHVKCMICFAEYVDKEKVRTMPCLHYFHSLCIDRWLIKKNSCPICNTACDAEDDQILQ